MYEIGEHKFVSTYISGAQVCFLITVLGPMSLVIDFVRLCLTMRWFYLQDNLVHIVVMIHSVS